MTTAEVYAAAIQQGRAGELCDYVVAHRPVPPRLLHTLRYRRFTDPHPVTRELWKHREPAPTLLLVK